MTHLLAASLCFAGFSALAAATQRQQIPLFGCELQQSRTRGLRILGTLLLLAALALLITNQGWGLGLVTYSGHTSLAAGCVHCALILQSRRADGPARSPQRRSGGRTARPSVPG